MKLKQLFRTYSKHALHVTALYLFISLLEYTSIFRRADCHDNKKQYALPLTIYVLLTQLLVLLALPQTISNLIGLSIYNAFPDEVKINNSLLSSDGGSHGSISGKSERDESSNIKQKKNETLVADDNSSNKQSLDGGCGGDIVNKSDVEKNSGDEKAGSGSSKAFSNGVSSGVVIDMPNGNSNASTNASSHSINLDNSSNNNIPLDANGDVPPKPTLPAQLPHLCFRVVTRGLYPALVQRNVNKNYLTCIESGLDNFSIEVVTDKKMYLSNTNYRVRQLVVPSSYRSSTGAMFKARALQYALEPKTSPVREGDYIVHLDEETLVTKNVIYGICNFALEGKHAFGQGLITYTSQDIVNWITTLADSYRVADDMGKMQFQLRCLHKPVFGWKGSFVVTKYEAELDVSFDHGPDGSIAEDCYFAMEAYKKGYTFDFIDGEMWEKSPFTILDLIRQRKRWIQGIWLVVHSGKIPMSKKYLLAMSHYAMLTLPITSSSFILTTIFPLPTPMWITVLGTFCFAITLYMYFFGVIKSFALKQTSGFMLLVYLFSQVIVLPINIVCENIATIWGLLGPKHNFYIVGKEKTETKIRNCR